jgi:hypothetical protein
VTLRIDGSFSIENSNMDVTGPAAIELIENPSPDTYTIRITTEGVYHFTAGVTDPDGVTHQDTIVITVMNREQLDRLLKAKWEGMKGALRNGSIDEAVKYIDAETKQHYGELFTALESHRPEIVQALQEIEFSRGVGNSAVYAMRRNELYGGQMETIDYSVYFLVDNDGLWKIDWF